MKRLIPVLAITGIMAVALISAAQVRMNPGVSVDWINKTNISPDGYGVLLINKYTDTIPDTFVVYDTTDALQGCLAWAAATMAYQGRTWDGISIADIDSIGARLFIDWSPDGDNWVVKDSTPAITDTLPHVMTVNIYNMDFMRMRMTDSDSGKCPGVDGLQQYVGFNIKPKLTQR